MLTRWGVRRLPCPLAVVGLMLSLLASPAFAQGASGQGAARDKVYWQAVIKNAFAVPPDVPLLILLGELNTMLGSPDPEIRDDIAYSVLANWIYRQRLVPEEERLRLLRAWEDNLKGGLGERGTDTVVLRSFSALSLGLLAILDNEAPYLDRERFSRLLSSTLSYLRDEQDVRGFDPRLGWLHAVAHTADTLKFLARSRHFQPAEQALVLMAIADKLAAVETPLVHGEDERLARAVVSIAARPDFDEAAFTAWLTAMTPARPAAPPTLATLAAGQNRRNLLVSLFTVLSTDRRDLPGLTRARTLVLETLKRFM